MPPSQQGLNGINLIRSFFRSNKNLKVLDVGGGDGRFSRLIRQYCSKIDTVEACGEYITNYNLKDLYDTVYHQDVLDFNWEGTSYDAVLLGDVLEHIDYSNAISLIKLLKEKVNYIFLSIPVTYCPQGATNGNIYEIHKYDWSDMEVRKTLGMNLQIFDLNELAICCIATYYWSKK